MRHFFLKAFRVLVYAEAIETKRGLHWWVKGLLLGGPGGLSK